MLVRLFLAVTTQEFAQAWTKWQHKHCTEGNLLWMYQPATAAETGWQRPALVPSRTVSAQHLDSEISSQWVV